MKCKVENAIVEVEDFGVTADGKFIDISAFGIVNWGYHLRVELDNRLPHFGIVFGVPPTSTEDELIAIDVEVESLPWEDEIDFHLRQVFHVRTTHFNDGTFYYTVEYERGTKGSFFHKTFYKAAYSVSEVATIITSAANGDC